MANHNLSLKKIQTLLQKDVPHPYPPPIQGTPSAVLFLISEIDQKIVLMKRPSLSSDPHSGQISFPGGRIEEQDYRPPEDMRTPSTWQRAALREFTEETGAMDLDLKGVGHLPPISTTTGYVIYPVVAWTDEKLSLEIFNPDPNEVEALILPGLFEFQDPTVHRIEMKTHQGIQYPIHHFQIQGHVIWGATAAIIHNFLKRLED